MSMFFEEQFIFVRYIYYLGHSLPNFLNNYNLNLNYKAISSDLPEVDDFSSLPRNFRHFYAVQCNSWPAVTGHVHFVRSSAAKFIFFSASRSPHCVP